MRHVKSERLKKLETELNDLEQWMKLGLVPKKDLPKHKEEIGNIKSKIEEELARLKFLKESGDLEEYTTPKRNSSRTGYTEMGTLPDVDMTETQGMTEAGFDMDNDNNETEAANSGEEETESEKNEQTSNEGESTTFADDDSYFSDRNRWRRGGILDPDADEW